MSTLLLHDGPRAATLSRRQAVALGATGMATALLGWPDLRLAHAPVLVADIVASHPELSIWHGLVRAAGLDRRFRSFDTLTAFVPVNEVFEENPDAVRDIRDLGVGGLRRFILSHVLAGSYPIAWLMGVGSVATLAGTDMQFDVSADADLTVSWNDGVFIAGTTITTSPLRAQNGLVYSLGSFVLSRE